MIVNQNYQFHFIAACFNRSQQTLQCLEAVKTAAEFAGVTYTFTLYDDKSSDDTVASVRKLEPHVLVIEGEGDQYWAASMAQAEAAVLGKLQLRPVSEHNDYIVWINDDTTIDPDSLCRMTTVFGEYPDSVVVGACRDPLSRKVTYSGYFKRGLHPLQFEMVQPSTSVTKVDSFNGNFVFVPLESAKLTGGIDGNFSHALADLDYGLRCSKHGIDILLAPGTYADCARNPAVRYVSILSEWRAFISVKGGGNPKSVYRFLRKRSVFVLIWAYPLVYFSWLVGSTRRRASKGTAACLSRLNDNRERS